MARIPTDVTKGQFTRYIRPHLSTAKRGYESDIPLYKIFNLILYNLYTGCPWPAVPIEKDANGQPVMSYQVPYYHFRKWSRDGSLQRLFDASSITIKGELKAHVGPEVQGSIMDRRKSAVTRLRLCAHSKMAP